RRLRAGDTVARDQLMEVVYATLHRIAEKHLRRERSGHTLQPTALVHEAYLKLFARSEIQFSDRAHFFAAVSQAMRRILVDHARSHAAAWRAQGGERVPLEEAMEVEVEPGKAPV